MIDEPLFDFAVPDDLLRDVVAHTTRPRRRGRPRGDAGTGEGKPPPLVGHSAQVGLRARWCCSPAPPWCRGPSATASPSSGTTSRSPSTCPTPALGAVAFVAQVSQLLWAVPLALWADRGSRKLVAAVALIIFAVFGIAHGLLPQRVGLRLLVPGGLHRVRREQHRPQLVPVRCLPDRGPGPGLQLAQPVRPAVADAGDPALRLRGHRGPQLALRPLDRLAGHPGRPSRCSPCASRRRGPTRAVTSSRPRAWTCSPSRRRRRACCWARP